MPTRTFIRCAAALIVALGLHTMTPATHAKGGPTVNATCTASASPAYVSGGYVVSNHTITCTTRQAYIFITGTLGTGIEGIQVEGHACVYATRCSVTAYASYKPGDWTSTTDGTTSTTTVPLVSTTVRL